MKKFISARLFGAVFVGALLVSSCSSDDDNVIIDPNSEVPKGFYIVNEGSKNNGSVSYLSIDNDSLVNYKFEKANGVSSTGQFVQSFSVANNKGFILVNGDNLVRIVSFPGFKQLKSIQATSPRYFCNHDTLGYISCWETSMAAGNIIVISLSNNAVVDTIQVGVGPENMLVKDKYLYVANSGAYVKDSTISIVDLETNSVVKTLNVGGNPTDLAFDANGYLWVMCKGFSNPDWSSGTSTLVKVDVSNYSIKESVVFGKSGDYNLKFSLVASPDAKTLYFIDVDGVHAFNVNTKEDILLIEYPGLYGLEVDPSTGDIYVADAVDFTLAGKVVSYTAAGVKKKTFEVGIAPNGGFFVK